MAATRFPHGVSSYGMPVIGAGPVFTTGNVFFVDSGATNASDASTQGTDPTTPFATIDYAIGQCTANNGDIIIAMPGHAEAPATTEGIDMDVAGVWVLGVGWGNDRPTITPANATVGIKMAAASCRISNVIMALGSTATVADAFGITAAGCIVENCEVRGHATSQYTNIVTVTDVEDVVIRDNVFRCLTTGASSTSGLNIDGSDYLQITGNFIQGFFAEHVIDNTTAGSVDECKEILIQDNVLRQLGTGTDLVVEMDANATGMLVGNLMSGTIAGIIGNVTVGNVRAAENYLTEADDASAVIVPVVTAV